MRTINIPVRLAKVYAALMRERMLLGDSHDRAERYALEVLKAALGVAQ